MNLTLKEIILSTGGELIYGRPDTIVASISTDTRTLHPGDMFVALKGPNFDGSQFTADAFERGAIGALVSGLPEGLQISDGECLVRVENTEKALGDIALLWRRKISPDILVVMGSSGKTTTREMIFQSLAAAFPSPDRRLFISANGNLNNTIGVPLTLFQIEPDTQLIVTEIGMNSIGEIRRLTEITDPDILVVTNIGRAHIGMFDSEKELIRAKAEVFEKLRPECLLIVNADCLRTPIFLSYARHPHHIVTYGITDGADIQARNISPISPQGYCFDLFVKGEKKARIRLPLFGRHNIYNALAAAAAAYPRGADMQKVAQALEGFTPPWMRSTVYEMDGVRVISDCYNANPDSMELALRSLVDVRGTGGLYVLLGDMLELGADGERFHREIGGVVAEIRPDLFITYGDLSHFMSDEAARRGVSTVHVNTHDDAARLLKERLHTGDTVLIKGSRLMKLETVTEELLKLFEKHHAVRLMRKGGINDSAGFNAP